MWWNEHFPVTFLPFLGQRCVGGLAWLVVFFSSALQFPQKPLATPAPNAPPIIAMNNAG